MAEAQINIERIKRRREKFLERLINNPAEKVLEILLDVIKHIVPNHLLIQEITTLWNRNGSCQWDFDEFLKRSQNVVWIYKDNMDFQTNLIWGNFKINIHKDQKWYYINPNDEKSKKIFDALLDIADTLYVYWYNDLVERRPNLPSAKILDKDYVEGVLKNAKKMIEESV